MVTLVKLDTHWLPEDPVKISILPLGVNSRHALPGAFWYEAETELGTKRVNIPISEIIIVNDPIIRSNGATNSRNGYPYPEPIPLEEALLEAKRRGGQYLEQRGSIYFVYRLKICTKTIFEVTRKTLQWYLSRSMCTNPKKDKKR